MSRPVMIVKRSSGTWWKCLLAFFGGILFTIGAVLGGAAFAAAAVNTGTLLGPYSYLLTEEYQNKTVLDIVNEVVAGELTFNNLGDVAKVTPEIEKIFDAINDSFENAGLHMEIRFDDIKDEPWSTLDIKIIDTFKTGVTLADVLKVNDESEPILQYLSYPKKDDGTYDKDNPYTLKEFMDDSTFFNNLINNLKIGDVVKPDADNLLMQALLDFTLNDLENKDKLYGLKLGSFFSEEDKNNNALLKTLSDNNWTINDLSDNDKFKTLKIGEIMTPTPGTIMDSIKDKTIGDLDQKDAFDDIEVGNIITINDDSTPIMKYLEHKTVGELKDDDLVNDMYISDIFTPTQIADSRVLTGLNNLPNPKHATDPAAPEYGCQVGEIGTRVNELALKDVMDTASSENKIVKKLENERIDNITNAINDLVLGDAIDYYEKNPSDGKYYSDQACTQELSPVLTKLIGRAEDPVEITPPFTITLKNDEFSQVVFTDGGDNKTDYLNISTFIQNTGITLSKHIEGDKVTWIAEGTGTASPARDPYVETFEVTVTKPAEWEHCWYYNCNKPTKVNNMNAAVDNLQIKDVMKIEPGSAFDKPAIKNERIDNASTLFDTIKSELTLGEVIAVTSSSSKILKTLEHTKLDQIGAKVDDLEFADVVDYYEKDPSDGKYYSDQACTQELPKLLTTFINNHTKVKNISSAVDNLYFADVVNYHKDGPDYYTDDTCTEKLPQILVTFIENNVKIKDMSSAITNLTIAEVLTDEQRNDRFLSKIPDDTKITQIGDAINNLKLVDVFEDQIFDTENADPAKKNKLVSTWKYLLIESDETPIAGNPDISTDPLSGYKCLNYKVSELNKLMDNMASNIERATLQDLKDDNIIPGLSDEFLTKAIPVALIAYAPPGATVWGDLTIKQLSDMLNHL